MRFAADERHMVEIIARMMKLQLQRQPELPREFVSQLVQLNITRGWIEEIVKTARTLGFDAIQGNEVDAAFRNSPDRSALASGVYGNGFDRTALAMICPASLGRAEIQVKPA